MGIDIANQHQRSRKIRKATANNDYHQLLIKLYKFMERRTTSKFNEAVYKRLNMSNVNRFPLSLSKLVKLANTEEKRQKILVAVAPILDDERLLVIPKMRICALKFSSSARRRIEKAGGECLTFD